MVMNNLKSRDEFLNEEIGKKTLAAGLLAGGLALGGLGLAKGLDAFAKSKTATDYGDIEMTSSVETTSLPNKFTMSKDIVTIGTDMSIEGEDGRDLGKVIERVLNIGTTFEYRDANGKLVASAHKKPFNLYTEIKIFDDKGVQIGTIEKEVLESLVSPYSIYSIKDASGRVIAKSEKIAILLPKRVSIKDNSGKPVAYFQKRFIALSATYDIEVYSNIDKRLIIFITAFLSTK